MLKHLTLGMSATNILYNNNNCKYVTLFHLKCFSMKMEKNETWFLVEITSVFHKRNKMVVTGISTLDSAVAAVICWHFTFNKSSLKHH